MNRELEEHALSIVLQLAESPAGDRDGLRNQLCGDDAPLSAAVADLWRAHEEAERKEFWQRPAHVMLGPSESPAVAQDLDNKASPDGGTQAETPSLAESARQLSDQARKNAESAAQDAQPRQPKSARFVAIDRLGVGGQGEVWLMLDPQIDRRVAMKIVLPKQKGSQSTLTLFRREAEVSGKLEHPNIVPVYDVTAELNESGQADPNSPCYVMRVFGDPRLHVAIAAFHERPRSAEDQPLLPALRAFDKEQSPEHRWELEARLEKFSFDPQQPCDQTLKTAVESILKEDSEAGTLTKAITKFHSGEWSEKVLKKLLNRFQRICEGVAYAHSRGVIHRDLKPDNIMLGEYGETLVADWGLAKVVGRDEEHQTADVEGTLRVSSEVDDPSKTRLGQLKGTPAYMSPEQAMGRIDELGPATDIYSLGAILDCLLTGQSPFTGQTVAEILSRVRDGEFPRPTEIEPRVPKALEAIVLKAMSLKPRDRYAKALDLAADVERWLNDEPVSAWPEPFIVRVKRGLKRNMTLVASTAAAVLMAAVASSIGFAVVSGKNSELDKKNLLLTASGNELRSSNERLNKSQAALEESNRDLKQSNDELKLERDRLELALEVGFKLLRGIEREAAWSIDDAYSDILQNGLRLPDRERAAMLPLYLALIDLQSADELNQSATRKDVSGMIGQMRQAAVKAAAMSKLIAALSNLNSAIKYDEKSGLAWLLKAQIRREILHEPAASVLPDWDRAVALLPQSSAVFSGRGWCYLVLKKNDEAQSDFKRAAELDNRNEYAQLGLGRLAETAGNHDVAARCFQAAAELPMRYNTDNTWRLAAHVEASYALWSRGRRRLMEQNPQGAFDDMLSAVQFAQPKDCPAIWENLLLLAQKIPVEFALMASEDVKSASSRFRERASFDFSRDILVAILTVRSKQPSLNLWKMLRERQVVEPSLASELTAEFESGIRKWIASEDVPDQIRQAVNECLSRRDRN